MFMAVGAMPRGLSRMRALPSARRSASTRGGQLAGPVGRPAVDQEDLDPVRGVVLREHATPGTPR